MANNNNFKLTLDTICPEGTAALNKVYYGKDSISAGQLTITQTGGTEHQDSQHMKVWCDRAVNPAKTCDGYVNADWEAFSVTRSVNFKDDFYNADGSHPATLADDTYYYHVVLRDEVGNESEVITTALAYFDMTPPTVVANSAYFCDAEGNRITLTNSKNVNLHFGYSDNLSKVATYEVTITGKAGETKTVTGTVPQDDTEITFAVTLPCLEEHVAGETNTASIFIADNAGNRSLVAVTTTIVLDTAGLEGDIIVKQGTATINDQWTNTQPVTIEIQLSETAEDPADCVGYKIWGDVNTTGGAGSTDKPASYTSVTKGTNPVVIEGYKLSSVESETKAINVEIIDSAGNVTVLTPVNVKYDASAPTASISADKTLISAKTGYNISKVTISGTDNLTPAADLAWVLYRKTGTTWTAWASGTGISAVVNIDGTSPNLVEGSNIFKAEVKDLATNTKESSELTIILDKTAPEGSVSVKSWLNKADFDNGYTPTFSATDVNGIPNARAWISDIPNDTAAKGTYQSAAISLLVKSTGGNVDISGASVDKKEAYYLHVELVDSVGNTNIIHSAVFGIDREAPTECTIEFTKDAYPSTAATVNLSAVDLVSGVSQYKVFGDITDASADWENVTATCQVTLSSGDGLKTVKVIYKDAAGNIAGTTGAPAALDTCELDTKKPYGSAEYFEINGTTKKATHTSVDSFIAKVTAYDDDGQTAVGDVWYKIYGDINTTSGQAAGITEAEAAWVKFATNPAVTSTLYFTANAAQEETVKEIYVVLKDNAENITRLDKVTFYYDTGLPEVDIENLDHDRLSKVHTERICTVHTAVTHYCDEVNFDFTPSEPIQAYKVVAYLDRAAANAGTHEDAAIGTTHGSIAMSATGLNSRAKVAAKITGRDLEIALGGTGNVDTHGEKDGLHFIVVYVEDLGGNWSASAVIPAE